MRLMQVYLGPDLISFNKVGNLYFIAVVSRRKHRSRSLLLCAETIAH
jgi:hypothetical protein